MKEFELKTTKDGSSTLFVPDLNETYHSTHGALQEALHVFVDNGIKNIDKAEITLLEVGFGTGLNAILTSEYSKKSRVKVNYIGIETVPISLDLIKRLNYLSLDTKLSEDDFFNLHTCDWEVENNIHDTFKFLKRKISIQEFEINEPVDLIYYDAFGPRAQIEMWNKDIFEKLFNLMSKDGLLVTYCAMGQFKRDLKSIGFEVKNVPGPPGKREMTLAYKRQ